ncbi:EAL domain-containing protein [Duganella sp. FT27W]|uniref:bifunctional diguanylate cyclase/phosphodiesterase n=1 Tax=Duganella sp. FT27W TaxID=2654636 RepID=UPI00128D670D|nr:EAL domain-containing protein [Duganella sp. FT27W]MPQ55832.1 EAL domain-containing protein [Duganella sp. FT27W]
MLRSFASRYWPWAWLLLALLAAAACWNHAVVSAERTRRDVEQTARRELAAHVDAFEHYLTRSIAQMDQVTMQLKHGWEQSGGTLQLDALYRDGMFTDPAFAEVAIYDANGRLLSRAGRRRAGRTHSAQGRVPASFPFHQTNNSSALRIIVPDGTLQANQEFVQFTRRLDQRDDGFAGVLALTLDAHYLTSFYNQRLLGGNGVVAVLGDASTLRMEEHGNTLTLAPGASLFATAPELGNGVGTRLMPGAAFYDHAERLVSWRHSSAYPVLAVAGMTSLEALAPAATDWTRRRNRAFWLGLLTLLLGALATHYSRGIQRQRVRRKAAHQAYRMATEHGSDGFYLAAAVRDGAGAVIDFDIIDCNARGAYFYGLERDQLIGRRISALDQGVFGTTLLPVYLKALQDGNYEDERQMAGDGRLNICWGRRRIVRVGDCLAITLQDVSERKLHERDIEHLALHDPLTGLPNRQWLVRELPRRLAATSDRYGALAVLLVDLDDFKHVNDTLGHGVGDQLLQVAAQRLAALMRTGDRVVRMGGDEFLLLVDPAGEGNDLAELALLAERVLAVLAEPVSLGVESHRIEASIGISCYPRYSGESADHEALLRHADIALFSAKSEQKGHYRFFDASQYVLLSARAHLKHSLAKAIDAGQLSLHYQARVDVVSGQPVSMEALLRWQHPTLGMVPPVQFIPLAEASGLINRLGELVMRQSCAQLAAWRDQGLPLVPVSINVSPRQFSYGSVAAQLARHLTQYELEADLLEVEITESAMVADQVDVQAELTAIRALGVRVFVDDFGTGYSSLSQLQRLRLDGLKVDKAFTRELDRSHEGRVFFQAIVSMARALGMTVVAEGVETPAQMALLRELGCHQAQGYLLGRPVAAAAMAVTLKEIGYHSALSLVH